MGQELAARSAVTVTMPRGEPRPPLRVSWDGGAGGIERRAAELLMDFCRHEEPETFRALFETAGPALLPLVRLKVRRSRGRVDPAELLTDTFAQVYRHRHTFEDRGPGSFVKWFLAIADNLVRQDARANARRARRELLVARSIEDRGADPFVCLLRKESQLIARMTYGQLRRYVLTALHELPPAQEQVLLLHTQEGMTYAAIARRLGLGPSAVAMRIRRARDRILRSLLAQIDARPGA